MVLDDLVDAGEQVADAARQGAADRIGRLIWLALALERWIVVVRETVGSGAGDAADPTSANLLASALIICFELSRNERAIDEAIALLRPLTDPGPDDSIGRPPRPPS